MNVKELVFGVVLLLPLQFVWGQDKIVATLPIRPWQIGLQIGGAHLLSSSSVVEQELQYLGISESQADKYYKHLKNGLYVSADVHYWFNNQLGTGLKYSLFSSSANTDTEMFFPMSPASGYASYDFGVKEQVDVNYMGPSFIAGQWLNQQHTLQLTEAFSIGYAHIVMKAHSQIYYHPVDNSKSESVSVLSKGGTLGGNLEIAFAYYPIPEVSVAVNAGFFYAKFNDLDVSSDANYPVEWESSLNMSRLNAAIGLQVHF
ncbi:hypothetical protein AGMMS4957_01780 [Bacteroidia bacterium]|nr:hypothetical protein AGMMS4957_01780 [Bacteroidia bacterium]